MYCPILLRPAEPDTGGTGGTSDDTAIPIDDIVSAEEFVIFLDYLYRGFVLSPRATVQLGLLSP